MKISEDFKHDPKRILCCAIALIILMCGYFYHAGSEQKKKEKEILFKKELAISTLPQGIEQLWLQYINRRLNEEIQLSGRNLRVRTTYIGAPPSYAYVSIEHPYQIDCNTFGMGISVNFGESEASPNANITGNFSIDYKNEPSIGVNPNSIAAKNLDQKTCNYVATWLSQLTSK